MDTDDLESWIAENFVIEDSDPLGELQKKTIDIDEMCLYCGQEQLHWVWRGSWWRLYDEDKPHTCNEQIRRRRNRCMRSINHSKKKA